MPNPVDVPIGPVELTETENETAEQFVSLVAQVTQYGTTGTAVDTPPTLVQEAPNTSPVPQSLTTSTEQQFVRQLGVALAKTGGIGGGGGGGTTISTAHALVLSVTSQVIAVEADGTGGEPSSVTFTATAHGGLAGEVSFSIISGTATLTGAGLSRYMAASDMSTDSVTVRCEVTDEGVTYFDQVTVVKVKAGSSAITAFLTNESHTLAADADGVVGSFAGASTDLVIYIGATNDSANWTIEANPSTGVSIDTLDQVNLRVTVTAMSVDSGYIDITASRDGYSSITKRFTLAKSRTGAAAQLLSLTSTAQVFTYDSQGDPSPGSQTITFTASLQGIAGTADFTCTLYDSSGTSQGTVTLGGSGNTRTLTAVQFSTAASAVVIAEASGLSDQITVVRLSDGTVGLDGQDALAGYLTNEAVTVAAANDGTVNDWGPAGGTFKVFEGLLDRTGDPSVTYSVQSSTGVTINIAGTGIYTVSGMSADTGTATLRAAYGGLNIDKVYSIAKSRVGNTGATGAAGAAATAYWVTVSPSAVQKDAAGAYVQTSITAYGYSATGTGSPAAYSGRFIIATTTNGSSWDDQYTSSGDESSHAYNVPASIVAIRVRFYISGGATLLDEQVVPIVTDGTTAITPILSNASHTVPASSAGVVSSYVGSGTTIRIYEGSTALTFAAVLGNGTFILGTPTISPGGAINVGSWNGTGTTTLTVADHSDMLSGTATCTITYPITVRRANGTDVSVSLVQTITKSIAGAAGAAGTASTSYWMTSSPSAVSRTLAGAFSPTSVTFSSYSQTGAASPAAYSGRFIVATSNDGSSYVNRYTSSSDEASYVYSSFPSDTVAIRVRLYLAGGTASLLDEQVVPIVRDGTDAITPIVSNASHTVPSASTGAVLSYVGSGTTIQIYEGSTLLTFRASLAVSSYTIGTATVSGPSTITVGAYSGQGTTTATVAQHSAMSNSGSTCIITYPVTVRRANGSDVSFSVTQTITKSYTGADSTSYWITASPAAVRKTTAGAFSPTSVLFSGYSAAGSSSPAAYAGRFIIATSTDGTSYTDVYTSAGNEASYTHNLAGSTVAVRGRLYLAGGTTTLLDEQVVPVVADGSLAITPVMANTSHTVPADASGAVLSYTGSGTTIQIYEGSTLLTFANALANGAFTIGTPVVSPSGKITVGALSGQTTTTATVADHSGMSALIDDRVVTITYPVTVRRASGVDVTLSLVQTVTKSLAGPTGSTGAAATVYWVVTSPSAVGRTAAGAYQPTSVTVSSYSATGAGSPASYAGRYIIATTTNGTSYSDQYTSSGNESSYSYTLPAGIVAMRVRLYLAGGTTTLLDEQVVPIVADGSSALTPVMSNGSHTLPASSDGTVTSYVGSGTTIQVFEGSTALTYNGATLTAPGQFVIGAAPTVTPTSAITVGARSGVATTTATVAQHSAMSVSESTCTITYAITARRANGTDVSLSLVQTLTKSVAGAAGTAGVSATAYWVTASPSAVQKTTSGSYVPTSVSVASYSATGAAGPVAYAGRFIIATTTNGTAWTDQYTSSGNESSYSYALPASIVAMRVRLYLAGGTSTLLDEQVVPVVSDGSHAITPILSNASHTVPAQGDGTVTSYTGSGTTIQIFEGSTALTFRTTIATSSFTIGTPTIAPVGAITVGSFSGQTTTTATVGQHSAMSAAQPTCTITYPITARRADGTDVALSLVQTITKSLKGDTGTGGQNATAYWMVVSPSAIQKTVAGTFVQTTITLSAYSATGTGGPVPYAGRFVLASTANGTSYTDQYTSASDESSASGAINFPTDVVSLRVRLYAAGGTTTLLDEQFVPIVTDGSPSITTSLANASHTVPAQSNGAVTSYVGSGTTLQVYEGSTALTFVAVLSNGTYTIGTPTVSPLGAITVGARSGSGTPTSVVADHSAMSNTEPTCTITYPLTVRRLNGTDVTLSVVQTITKSIAGVSATTYWVSASPTAVQRSAAGVYAPTSVTFNSYSKTGINDPAAYAGRFIVATSTNGVDFTNQYTSSSDQSSYSYSLPAGILAARARLYLAGGTATFLDEVVVPVVTDGASALTPVLSNASHTVPATDTGSVTSYTGSGTTIQVYEGSTRLTFVSVLANGTFRVDSTTVSPTSAIAVGPITGTGTDTATVGDHSGMVVGQPVCTIAYNLTVRRANGADVTLSVLQTITKSIAGSTGPQGPSGGDALVAYLTTPTLTLPADANGNLSGSAPYGYTTLKVMRGGVDESLLWSFFSAPASSTAALSYTGINTSPTLGNNVLTVQGLNAGVDTVIITLTAIRTNQPTLTANFSVAKVRQGAQGPQGGSGPQGQRGSITVYKDISPSTAWSQTWVNTIYAELGLTPIIADVITLHNPTAGYSETRTYTYYGGVLGWWTVAQVIDGNLLVRRTVTAEAMAARSIRAEAIDVDALKTTDFASTGTVGGADEVATTGAKMQNSAAGGKSLIVAKQNLKVGALTLEQLLVKMSYSNWMSKTLPLVTTYRGLSYIGSGSVDLLAVGDYGACWTNTLGASWTQCTGLTASPNIYRCALYGANVGVLVGENHSTTGSIHRSADGGRAFTATSAAASMYKACVGTNSFAVFIGGAAGTTTVTRTTNGTTWTYPTIGNAGTSGIWAAIARHPTTGRIVAHGYNSTNGGVTRYSDDDGVTWSALNVLPSNDPTHQAQGVSYLNGIGRFIAWGSRCWWSSSDGASWSRELGTGPIGATQVYGIDAAGTRSAAAVMSSSILLSIDGGSNFTVSCWTGSAFGTGSIYGSYLSGSAQEAPRLYTVGSSGIFAMSLSFGA